MSSSTTTTSTTIGTTTSSSTKTKSHYEAHSAESYDSAFFYEVGPYMKHLRDLCYHRLQLNVRDWNITTTSITQTTTSNISSNTTSKRILLDIGGGTGTFTRTLITDSDINRNNNVDEEMTTNIEAIVIDPYLEFNSSLDTTSNSDDSHNNKNNNNTLLRFIKAPAEAFIMKSSMNEMEEALNVATTVTVPMIELQESSSSQQQQQQQRSVVLPQKYHQILMKEVIHHFADSDRKAIFHGLYHYGLIPTNITTTTTDTTTTAPTTTPILPSILIITRPQLDIDYPLWDEAKVVWAQNQPSLEVLIHELEMVGFTHVNHTIESYPCSIPFQRWCSMIQNRFWSTFTNFTDEELQQACQLMETNEKHRITDDGMIHFDDRLVFITACKIVN